MITIPCALISCFLHQHEKCMTIILDSFILVIKFYAVNYRALPKNRGISIITPFIGKYLFDPEGWIVHCPGLRGWRAWRITVRWR